MAKFRFNIHKKSNAVDTTRSISEITTAFKNLSIILVAFVAIVTIAVIFGLVPNPLERLGFGVPTTQNYSANLKTGEDLSNEEEASNYEGEEAPKYYGKILISHAKCVDAVDQYGIEKYRLDIAGNVNASVGAFLGLSTNPLSGEYVEICPSWTIENKQGYEYCKRYTNDPELTTWTLVNNNFAKHSWDKGLHIYVTAMVMIEDNEIAEGYRVVLDQATYDITCID